MSHLKKPTEQAEAVFAVTLANNPEADMRAIPNEWLLRERAITDSVAYKLEDRIDTLTAEVEALRKERDAYRSMARCHYEHRFGVACNKCGWYAGFNREQTNE